MSTSVMCLARNEDAAIVIVDQLEISGFDPNDVSVLYPDTSTDRDFGHEMHSKAPEGAATGASTGGLLGEALGWLVGMGTLAIPGVGPFIAAGPIMAALSGAAIGATVGGIGGALVGLGIPEIEARRYAGKLRDGRILISVHAMGTDEINTIKKIFKDAGAEDIASTTESPVDRPFEDRQRDDRQQAMKATSWQGFGGKTS
jgi:hypothetical protein